MTPTARLMLLCQNALLPIGPRCKMQRTAVVGGTDSIASKLQGYELLVVERELAS